MQIISLQQNGKQWSFRNATNSLGVYFTNQIGNGLFFQNESTGETKQIAGTCQFVAGCTEYETEKRIHQFFPENWADIFIQDPFFTRMRRKKSKPIEPEK